MEQEKKKKSYLICQPMEGPCQPIHGCCKGQVGIDLVSLACDPASQQPGPVSLGAPARRRWPPHPPKRAAFASNGGVFVDDEGPGASSEVSRC